MAERTLRRDRFLCPVTPPPPITVRAPAATTPAAAVTAVVVHWEAPEWCAATVASLRTSVGVTMRIIVVDNSADTLPYAATGAEDVVLPRTNDGYSGGANHGLRWWTADPASADEQFVLVASHDAVVHERAVQAMVTTMQQLPHVGAVGVAGGGGAPAAAPTGDTWTATPVRWVSGSLMLLARDTLGVVGLFDERLPSYVEDVDLCFRCWDTGRSVLAVDAIRLCWNGSRSMQAKLLINQHWLRLAAKRRGLFGLAVVSAFMLRPLVKVSLASVAPWSTDERRRSSRGWARLYRTALADGWRHRRLMRTAPGDTVGE